MAIAQHFAQRLEWEVEDVYQVGQELAQRGYVEMSGGPSYLLTPEGTDEVEDAIMSPERPESAGLQADVRRRQEDRTRLLLAVYEAAEGRLMELVNLNEVVEGLGLERDEVFHLAKWLDDRRLVKFHTLQGVLLTEHGIDRVEEAERAPAEPAVPGIAAVNNVTVSDSPGANINIIQGAPGAVIQSSSSDIERAAELEKLLGRIRGELDLDDEALKLLDQAHQEAAEGRPDSSLVVRRLSALGQVATQAGASALGSAIFAYMAGIPPF